MPLPRMYQNIKLYHNTCINHAPTPVPYQESTIYHNLYVSILYHIMYRSCIKPVPCTIYHVPYHVHQQHTMYQSHTISCHTPYTNKPRYEPTTYLTKYTSTRMYHASNDVHQVIKQISQTHASIMLLNITKMQNHNTI
jgi:hypothetical protein